jgi:hypothetical protein
MKQLFFVNEVVRLENEIFFFKLSLEWSMDDHMKDSKKSPIYQFQLLVIGI